MASRSSALALLFCLAAVSISAQTTAVPRLIHFTGIIKNLDGSAHTGSSVLKFTLYDREQDGAALWTESQTLSLDEEGHYSVLLGSVNALPLGLFASGKSLWLQVELVGQSATEQPRVLMVSVPYALKAADADTLGGKPASAYITQDAFNT